MADLHMEGLSDEQVLEAAEQALASLHVRFTDPDVDDRTPPLDGRHARQELGERAEEIGKEITAALDHFDRFAALVRDTWPCEGCSGCQYPGIRWPASPDGISDLSYVERCDTCERYENDEDAAKHVAEQLGLRWGYAHRYAHPKTDDDIRWAPPGDDGLDYTGWSAFVDHPERDGDPVEKTT